MASYHIDEVHPKDESNVIIVNFQNGYLNSDFRETECLVLQNENGARAVATDMSDFIYSGQVQEEQLGKTLILVRNKITGTVRLMEVDSVDLKPMTQSNIEATQLMDNSYLELGRKFGSKRQKTILDQREKLKLNEKSVAEQMKDVSQNITQEQLDISSINTSSALNEDFYLPPRNKDATNVQDVYPLHCFLTEDQYEAIYSEIEHTDYTTKLTPFIAKLVTKDTPNRLKVLAFYANSIFAMSKHMAKEAMKKSYVPCEQSETLSLELLKTFFLNNNGKRTRPLHYKDKALCFAVVALLILADFKFDLAELATSVKLPLPTLMSKVTMTGAYVKSKGAVKLVELKIPLNKPSGRISKR